MRVFNRLAVNRVWKSPGSTSTAWIPNGRTSMLRASIIPSSANLGALYNPWKGSPIRPPIELIVIRRPDCWSRIVGSTARQTRSTPKKLVSNWAWASSIEVSSTAPA